MMRSHLIIGLTAFAIHCGAYAGSGPKESSKSVISVDNQSKRDVKLQYGLDPYNAAFNRHAHLAASTANITIEKQSSWSRESNYTKGEVYSRGQVHFNIKDKNGKWINLYWDSNAQPTGFFIPFSFETAHAPRQITTTHGVNIEYERVFNAELEHHELKVVIKDSGNWDHDSEVNEALSNYIPVFINNKSGVLDNRVNENKKPTYLTHVRAELKTTINEPAPKAYNGMEFLGYLDGSSKLLIIQEDKLTDEQRSYKLNSFQDPRPLVKNTTLRSLDPRQYGTFHSEIHIPQVMVDMRVTNVKAGKVRVTIEKTIIDAALDPSGWLWNTYGPVDALIITLEAEYDPDRVIYRM